MKACNTQHCRSVVAFGLLAACIGCLACQIERIPGSCWADSWSFLAGKVLALDLLQVWQVCGLQLQMLQLDVVACCLLEKKGPWKVSKGVCELGEHLLQGQAAVLTGCDLHRDPCSAVAYACNSGKIGSRNVEVSITFYCASR